MSLAQAMEHLAEEIRSVTASRSADLSDLRQEVAKHQQAVKSQMHGIQSDNRRDASILKGKLSDSRKQLASEEKSRQNTARQETEHRRVAKSELRASTHSLLSRARLECKETAKALQEKIAAEISNLHNAVNNIRWATKSTLGEIAADLCGAHEAWVGQSKKKY